MNKIGFNSADNPIVSKVTDKPGNKGKKVTIIVTGIPANPNFVNQPAKPVASTSNSLSILNKSISNNPKAKTKPIKRDNNK